MARSTQRRCVPLGAQSASINNASRLNAPARPSDSQPKDSVRDMVPCCPRAARFNALEHADYYTGEGRKGHGFPRTLAYKILSGFSKLAPNHKTVS
jgi:hypothetical protein